jgi:hypothetical protein
MLANHRSKSRDRTRPGAATQLLAPPQAESRTLAEGIKAHRQAVLRRNTPVLREIFRFELPAALGFSGGTFICLDSVWLAG